MAGKILEGKVALITGSARGIGRAIAEKMALEGANVIITDINEEGAKQAAQEIAEKYGVKTLAFAMNVTDKESVEKVMDAIVEEFGRIDILVNNAGVTKDNLAIRMTDEDWDFVLNVNLKGVFICSRAAIKRMIKQKSGSIVNIASIVGIIGNPGQANYSASKGGVIALTKTLAKEYAGKGIRVNAVAPGFIDTEMTKKLPEKAREAMLAQVPMKRMGLPEDVAKAVAFLASDEASYISAEVLVVDGGMTSCM